jgi:hypothetical protein
MERLAVVRRIGMTSFYILTCAHQAHHVRGSFAGLADHGIRPKVPSFVGLFMKACFADLYHQVTGASFDRSRFDLHAMQVLTILSVFDHYIDEIGLSLDERESIFDDLESAFLSGEKRKSRFRQTRRATELTCEFHGEISRMPGAEWYFEQCGELLFSPAREEAFGTPTVEVAAQIGRGTLGAIGGILHAHDPQLPRRHIEAYRSFGAALNLVDDVADYEHDRAQGTRTAITAASDVEATSKCALAQARESLSNCAENLVGDEVFSYMALASLVRAKWNVNLAYADPATLLNTEQDSASQI